jgi:hypothetical protein
MANRGQPRYSEPDLSPHSSRLFATRRRLLDMYALGHTGRQMAPLRSHSPAC